MRWTSLQAPRLVVAVALCVAAASIAPGVASALPSEPVTQFAEGSPSRQAQIAQIMAVLARPDAQRPLRIAGFSPAQVERQLARLDDAQLARLADQSETISAAGDGVALLGVLVLLAVLVFVVLSIVDRGNTPP